MVWGLGVVHPPLSTVSVLSDIGAPDVRQTGSTLIGQRGIRVQERAFHRPAMLDEVLRWLAPQRGGTFLDGTVGGAGHARAILEASDAVRLLAMDRDADALQGARERLQGYGARVYLARGNYADAAEVFDLGEGALAGVLLDLGVSSHQIDTLERGFSFRPGAPLDMRMSRESTRLTAEHLLNNLTEDDLADVFWRFGEERRARRLARAVVRARAERPLRTSDDLMRVLERVWRRPVAAGEVAPVFQALRIAVNEELSSLERALPALRHLLAASGRMVVIAYHSLEDRLVKRAFREWSRECVCPPGLPVCRCRGRALGREPVRGPLRPDEREVAENPRARSARLRVWERAA
jgi:16S rRNA (cytosine1402-N4)-methyltransferase